MPKPSRLGKSLLIVLGIVLAIGLILGLWKPLEGLLASAPHLRAWIRGFGPWAPVALVVVNVVQIVVAPVPGQFVDTVAGYLFGPWWGTLYGLIGVLFGSSAAAFLTRTFGRPLLRRLFSPEQLQAWDGVPRVNSLWVWIAILLLPVGDIGYFVAGLTTLPLAKLSLAAVVSHIPSVFIASLIGAQMVRMSPAGILSLALALAVLGLVLVFFQGRLRTLWNRRVMGFLRSLARRP